MAVLLEVGDRVEMQDGAMFPRREDASGGALCGGLKDAAGLRMHSRGYVEIAN